MKCPTCNGEGVFHVEDGIDISDYAGCFDCPQCGGEGSLGRYQCQCLTCGDLFNDDNKRSLCCHNCKTEE